MEDASCLSAGIHLDRTLKSSGCERKGLIRWVFGGVERRNCLKRLQNLEYGNKLSVSPITYGQTLEHYTVKQSQAEKRTQLKFEKCNEIKSSGTPEVKFTPKRFRTMRTVVCSMKKRFEGTRRGCPYPQKIFVSQACSFL